MIRVQRISKEDWKEKFAEDAHISVFKEPWPADFERIDFALLTVDDEDNLVQYVTLREMDKESVYLQYGGSFADYRGSIKSFESYSTILDYLSESYKNVGFLVENTNFPMLKFAIKKEFVIVGTRYADGKLFLEHFKRRI